MKTKSKEKLNEIENTIKRSPPEHVPLLQQFLICDSQLASPDKQSGHWAVEDIPLLQVENVRHIMFEGWYVNQRQPSTLLQKLRQAVFPRVVDFRRR